MPAITVAITTHNLGKFMASCLDELINQTFQDFDILVYDDCSVDATRDILHSYENKFGDKLKIILGDIPQKLPGKSRNAILDSGMIRGEYIVFLDGDDTIERTFLEQLYHSITLYSADISLCAYNRFEDESGHVLCTEMKGNPKEIFMDSEGAANIAFINTSLWNKLIRIDRIGELRFPDFPVGEDASFLLALYMKCQKICCVDQVLIHYRVRKGSVISNTSEQTIYSFASELYRMWRLAENRHIKDSIALAVFIHIGLSMPIRAYDNPEINEREVLKWISTYFSQRYDWFASCSYLKFSYLINRGFKGLCIWCALICHRLKLFRFLLWCYKAITSAIKTDFKF